MSRVYTAISPSLGPLNSYELHVNGGMKLVRENGEGLEPRQAKDNVTRKYWSPKSYIHEQSRTIFRYRKRERKSKGKSEEQRKEIHKFISKRTDSYNRKHTVPTA